MKRLLLIGCLFAAFACTKEPAELSGGSGPNPPRIVGTPTSELALKGEISIKLTPEMAQAVAVAQAQLPATRSGAVTRSGVGTIDEKIRFFTTFVHDKPRLRLDFIIRGTRFWQKNYTFEI